MCTIDVLSLAPKQMLKEEVEDLCELYKLMG